MTEDGSLQDLTRAAKSRLAFLEEEIPRLQRKRGELEIKIRELEAQRGQLRALVEGAPDPNPSARSPYQRTSGAEMADLVVALLTDEGQPMHYREIEARLRERGEYAGGGQDPANALLATYFNDPRLHRVSRGTYSARRSSNGQSAPAELAEPNYLSRRIHGFSINGDQRDATTWKDMLMGVARYCEARHPGEIDRLLSLRGTKRPYFSREQSDLRSPALIGRSGIYAEANLSANDIVKRCREMLQIVGDDPRGLKISSMRA